MAMGLTKSGGDGDFTPVFKFNAVSGDAVIASSAKNASGEWEKAEKDVSFPAKFIFDFAELEVGWMHFSSTGPSFAMVKIGERMPAAPSADHKQGFRVRMYNKEHGLCVFSNSSKTIAEVMDTLHDNYLRDEKANAGKVPVVEIKGVEKVSVKTKEGAKNYKRPVWSIVSWVAKPEAMTAKVVEESKVETASDDDF
jgi:hypothetical protein